MKKTAMFCVFACQMLITLACQSSTAQEQQQRPIELKQSSQRHGRSTREWQVATYRGLTLGRSVRAEMLSVLGEPEQSVPFDEDKPNPGTLYFYKATGEIKGDIAVAVDKRTDVILNVELRPGKLSKEEAIKHFGDNFLVTRYNFDSCLEDEEADSAPLYESPGGPIINLEYRERGIAVAVDEDDNVLHISYISEPVGAPSSKCQRFGK
jgi:hypothetical protein